jgi:hypothetical protein
MISLRASSDFKRLPKHKNSDVHGMLLPEETFATGPGSLSPLGFRHAFIRDSSSNWIELVEP